MATEHNSSGSLAGSLRITQVRSTIGTKPKHRGTIRALGLGRIGKTRTIPDRPELRGMLAKVPHLVTVEEVEPAEPTRVEEVEPAEPTLVEEVDS